MKSLTVQIPKPCHERWADMLPNEQGRFCASCRKTVVDYTTLSDRELARVLSQPAGTACGRFSNDQLNRSLPTADQDKTPLWRHWLGMLTMGILGWQTAQAQLSPKTVPQLTSVLPEYKSFDQSVRDTSRQDMALRITGTVLDIDSAGRQSPLPGANVVIKGKNRGTTTGVNGAFTLKIPGDSLTTPLTLVVSCIGFITQEIELTTVPKNLTISLQEDGEALNGVIVVGGYHVSRWQRLKFKLFHKNR